MVYRLISTALLSSMLYACSAPPKLAPEPGDVVAAFPEMKEGDSWVVTNRHEVDGKATFVHEVSSVDDDGSFDMKISNNKDEKIIYQHFSSHGIGVPLILDVWSDAEALQFPLFVGKEWEIKTTFTLPEGESLKYTDRYSVKEFTKVQTAAGQFEAFRIVLWTVSNPGAIYLKSEYWYAPKAKAIVMSSAKYVRGLKLQEVNLVE